MVIRKSTLNDIVEIFAIYDLATAYQKTVNNKSWKGFERTQVELEIAEGRHFIIHDNQEIAATFLITHDDPIIWKNANQDFAIYLHRIATKPKFRGRYFVKKIVEWARAYANEHGQQFIRLDTHSGNEKINSYYSSCGFIYKGISEIEWTPDLPEHYKDGSFSLFEIELI